MAIIQGTSKSSAAAAYTIDQSIRFNSADSATMSRSFGTPTDRNKFTWSYWVKSTKEQNGVSLGINVSGGVTFASMIFNGGNMAFYDYTSGSANIDVRTTFTAATGKFRDYSAWYHAMFVYDSDQSTDSNRLKFYINGTQFPAADLVGPLGGSVVWPGSGADSKFNASGTTHLISDLVNGKIDGYMAEINFVDGQALDPTSFGKTNSTTGQWVPIEYTGSYGTNGFRLQGSDSSDLGEDTSGNSNDFTSSGLAAADQVSDSPTANHCTLNPLWVDGYTLSDGNLVTNQSGDAAAIGTMAFDPTDSQGFYFEAKVTTAASFPNVGIRTIESCSKVGAVSNLSGNSTGRYSYTGSNGQFNDAGSGSSYGDAWSGTADKVIGVYIKAGELFFSVDGTIQNSGTAAKTGLTGLMVPTVFYDAGSGTQAAWEMRFDASDWSTTPSGYKALSTANLDDPTTADPSAYFQATTYTGDGSSSNEINQTGNSTFEPTMVWIKSRSAATDHVIQDQVRGNFIVYPNQSSAEGATGGGWVSSFDSDGFTVNVNGPINASGETFVGWQWKANGSGSSNTDGNITSTVSADTTSGFSVLTYSGNGSDNQTIGHGLGIAPKMIITKRRDSSGNWTTYHDAVGINQVFYLNSTSAPTSNTEQYRATPTSNVYTVGVGGDINNSSGTYVAYVFAEVEGFSKISSYTGNGSTDGPFVYTGFKPAFVIFKNISAAGQAWEMFDNKRDGLNDANRRLYPNTSEVEPAASDRVRLLSNGFKIVTSGGTHVNGSGNTIIYMAFAESPFKTATAR